MQILQEVQQWGAGSGIRAASFIGGANVKRQLEKLKKHIDVEKPKSKAPPSVGTLRVSSGMKGRAQLSKARNRYLSRYLEFKVWLKAHT